MELQKIKKEFIKLNKLKRKELDDIAFKLGIDTRYQIYDCAMSPSYTKEDNLNKAEVIFTIIEIRIKKGIIKTI